MNIKDTDIKEFAKSKIELAKQEIKKWQLVLDALGEVRDNGQLNIIPPNVKTSLSKSSQSKLSIMAKVQHILRESDCPLTTRDIMESINHLFPDRIYDMGSFSGAFSLIYRKPEANISKYMVKNASTQIRALYGFNEWFDEKGNLKEEYDDKVLERYKVI